MSGKIIAETEFDRKRRAGTNVKAYRKEMGWTQEKCAEEWDLSVLTIRRLELNAEPEHYGEYPATRKTAEKISDKTGIYWEYWFGLSSFKEKKRYEDYLQEEAAMSIGLADAQENAFAEHIKKVNSYRELFFMLGYEYENNEGTAAYEFSEIIPSLYDGNALQPHSLTPINGNGKKQNLSDTQLETTISYLKKQLNFAMFNMRNS